MARTFRRQRQSHPIAEMNVTNLIDLGFTLLIIFMIATPLITQEQKIPINLPVESKSPQKKPDPGTRYISIAVDARGYHIDNQTAVIGLAELRSRLQAWAAETKPPVIDIRGDTNVPYGKIVQLMDELKKASLMNVQFATQPNG